LSEKGKGGKGGGGGKKKNRRSGDHLGKYQYILSFNGNKPGKRGGGVTTFKGRKKKHGVFLPIYHPSHSRKEKGEKEHSVSRSL